MVGCLTARQHRKVNLCQLRGRETGSVGYADGQRDAMHIRPTLRYTITSNVTQFELTQSNPIRYDVSRPKAVSEQNKTLLYIL